MVALLSPTAILTGSHIWRASLQSNVPLDLNEEKTKTTRTNNHCVSLALLNENQFTALVTEQSAWATKDGNKRQQKTQGKYHNLSTVAVSEWKEKGRRLTQVSSPLTHAHTQQQQQNCGQMKQTPSFFSQVQNTIILLYKKNPYEKS